MYTHRYYVAGRVVDADGEPVSGARVHADLPGVPLGPCAGYQGNRTLFRETYTGPEGDFQVCFHAHAFQAGQEVALNLSGEPVRLPADADLRRTVVLHRLATASDLKDAGALQFFPFRYTVTGRAWNASGPVLLENVPGNGTPLDGAEVTATLLAPGKEALSRTVRADAYGDYFLAFQLGEIVENGTIRVSTRDVVETVPLDPALRRSAVNLVVGKPPEEPVVETTPTVPWQDFLPPTDEAPPGSNVPAPGALLALAALGAATLALRGAGRFRKRE